MRVIGIDPSLSRTGVAVVEEGRLPVVFSLPTTGSRAATLDERAERIDNIVLDATGPADGAYLAAIEGPAFNHPGGSTWDRAGLWWRMADRLWRKLIPTATVSPKTRAKWATGHGNAGKAAVQHALETMWNLRVRNDDEADALALATMAAQWAGMNVPTLDHQPAALRVVAWPIEDPNEGVAI